MRKILYLHPHFTLPGGAGRFVVETAKLLTDKGYQVHIAAIRIKHELVTGCEGIVFHELGGPLSSSVFYWVNLPILLFKVTKLISIINPDIVFSQVFPANWWGFVAKIINGNKIFHVWMCQEPSAFIHSRKWIFALPMSAAGIAARVLNPILKILDVSLSGWIDAVFANSKFSKTLAIDAYGYASDQVNICYPGVDINRFVPKLESKIDKFCFICCSRLTKFKNVHCTLSAIAKLGNKELKLLIVGDGEEYAALVELAEQLGIADQVTFYKVVSDAQMVSLLQSSAALIHAAEEEPFGLAPVEAMACGTPVIAIKGGGPSETVLHQQTGYLCESASVDQIAMAIEWCTNHADLTQISKACIQQAGLFTWHQSVDSLESVFVSSLRK